jgi:hypothetical protein
VVLYPEKLTFGWTSFRGAGQAGTSVEARLGVDIKVGADGLIQPGRGISVNIDPSKLPTRYGPPSEIASVPSELEIVQYGKPGHYEIAPRQPMTPTHYQELLNQVKFK